MAVTMMPREAWTDERLDDLSQKMDREFDLVRTEAKAGFDRVDARFDRVDARFDRVDARFDRVDARFECLEDRFGSLEKRFESLEDRFAALNRTLIGSAFAVCAAIFAASIF